MDTIQPITAEELLTALNRAQRSYNESSTRDTKNVSEQAFHNAYAEIKNRKIAIHQERNVWKLGDGEGDK